MAPRRGLADDPLTRPSQPDRPRRLPPIIPTTIADDDPVDPADADSSDGAADESAPPAPAPAHAAAGGEEPHSPQRALPKRTKSIGRGKTQLTSYIDSQVLDSARDAVLSVIARPGGHRSLSGLVEEAMRREIVRLQDEFNRGRPFPKREVELQAGRISGS